MANSATRNIAALRNLIILWATGRIAQRQGEAMARNKALHFFVMTPFRHNVFVGGLVSDGYREGAPTQIVVRPLGDSNSLPKQTKSKSPDQMGRRGAGVASSAQHHREDGPASSPGHLSMGTEQCAVLFSSRGGLAHRGWDWLALLPRPRRPQWVRAYGHLGRFVLRPFRILCL